MARWPNKKGQVGLFVQLIGLLQLGFFPKLYVSRSALLLTK